MALDLGLMFQIMCDRERIVPRELQSSCIRRSCRVMQDYQHEQGTNILRNKHGDWKGVWLLEGQRRAACLKLVQHRPRRGTFKGMVRLDVLHIRV